MSEFKDKFTKCYSNNLWSMGQHESRSGMGSTLDYTQHARVFIVKLLEVYNFKSVIDVCCGDWNWMKEIKDFLPNYVGIDIVEELINKNNEKFKTQNISFICGDAVEKLREFESGSIDLGIIRHAFGHIPEKYNIDLLHEITRVTKYSLLTSENKEIKNYDLNTFDGVISRNINLTLSPYKEILGNPRLVSYDSKGEILDHGCFLNFYKNKV